MIPTPAEIVAAAFLILEAGHPPVCTPALPRGVQEELSHIDCPPGPMTGQTTVQMHPWDPGTKVLCIRRRPA